jgi:hypothetical protein
MKQAFYVCNRTNAYVPQPIGTLNVDLSADSAPGETPPTLVGGKTHADAIYTSPESNPKRSEGNEETKYNETSKLLQCPPYLSPRLYTPTPKANPDAFGQTQQPHLGRF